MLMATDLNRRDWFGGLGKLALTSALVPLPAFSAAPTRVASGALQFAAARQIGETFQVGWLSLSAKSSQLEVAAVIDVPTRAHGLSLDANGALLAVARRPGDWLLRWQPRHRPQWHWMPSGRHLNGHALPSADGKLLLTTESDAENGDGWLGVRDIGSLELIRQARTNGKDPHQLVRDRHHGDCVLVANGGIQTRPETGRVKYDLAQMDSTLVRIDPLDGKLKGQWRLEDSRLSLRHLAWNSLQLGLALQAEHDDANQRADAPVLAIFDGAVLRLANQSRALAGYGGDVAAFGNGFAVSCPKADGVAYFDNKGLLVSFKPLDSACALASNGAGSVWAAGKTAAEQPVHSAQRYAASLALPIGLRIDNHWLQSPA